MRTEEREESSHERESVWSSIAERLTQDIASGQHPAGARLPTEHMLAQQFGANRHTVRRALSSLASRGLVRMVQGSGTYVEDFAMDVALGRRTRHSENLLAAGVEGALQVTGRLHLRATAEIARALALPARSRVLQIDVLGEGNGRPILFSQRWFPLPRFEGLAEGVEQTGSITRAFAALIIGDRLLRPQERLVVLCPI
ncbi:mannosyl-D-glycerate transport/metabolism system repressor MngR [mine drainage metagenome]|uniref:Mannosyl-D-glycerate transport/metabolism system repressor MngR n=1 Tax=mine drainage metagenome TaxID=410659 RepID=A0A1J5Q0N4_9ZZZZ